MVPHMVTWGLNGGAPPSLGSPSSERRKAKAGALPTPPTPPTPTSHNSPRVNFFRVPVARC
jgi:hypothetical protein